MRLSRYETKVHPYLYESPMWRTYVIFEELLMKVPSSSLRPKLRFIPHICQFWYTAILLRLLKRYQKVHNKWIRNEVGSQY